MTMMYTIGFTKKTAKDFFELLKANNVRNIIDVRLRNASQLAGFAKKNDLEYFLQNICGIGYMHYDFLAPTQKILDDYKKKVISWEDYEFQFNKLLLHRDVLGKVDKEVLNNGCLLCSESSPKKCHRRLVAEHLSEKMGGLMIKHL